MRSYRRNFRSKHLTVALYLNAAAIVLVALALFARSDSKFPSMIPAAMGQNQLPIGGGAGVFIVPAQFTTNNFGCYIMDVDAQTICAYQFIPAEHSFRLVASRTYRFDRKLSNYNTTPSPNDIKSLVDKEQTEIRAGDPKKTPPSPEGPAENK